MDSASDRKLRKSTTCEKKPLMLKDYLMDDLSSCSSNGFKSFPRSQCCTTVRFLLEIDLKPREPNTTKRLLKRSRSRAAASTTLSALQRASEAVINAVKHFPFPSVKSPSASNRRRKGHLPRSVSRKLLKKSFWRKAERNVEEEKGDIRRCRLFHEFLQENHKPSDQNTTSTSSNSNSNSHSWAESEFASDVLRSSSSNSKCSTGNDVVDSEKDLSSEKVNEKVDVTVGEDSMECSTTTTCSFQNAKGWPNEEEKEQFSPVSVLDCPFEDEDEATSPFRPDLALIKGTKQKLVHKIRRFENLGQLKPVDLDKRMAMTELEDETLVSSMESNSLSLQYTISNANHGPESVDKLARELVKMIFKTTTSPSNTLVFKADNLLFDFFRESIVEEYQRNAMEEEEEEELLKVAEDWINGKPQEVLLGWEVKQGRNGYVKDMEKGGRWRKLDEEKEQVVLELEIEVWNTLLKELLLDLLYL